MDYYYYYYTTKSFQVWKPAGLQDMAREGAGAGIQ